MSTNTISSRAQELSENIYHVKSLISQVEASRPARRPVTLVAVSKYKPASDILDCYNAGQRDFGENYVQEFIDKAKELPADIRWHFIGTLQSNKAKALAATPNLHALHTLTSSKTATLLSKNLSPNRTSPLKVFIQINTSHEDSKSGLSPLSASDGDGEDRETLISLCKHVIRDCPGLHLEGLMTIGSIVESKSSEENKDFARLSETKSRLEETLRSTLEEAEGLIWGEEVIDGNGDGKGRRQLLLSMGMSSDFEEAIRQGSDFVRVGTGIFGQRQTKSG
ncbi:hypothetical protein SISNIDRAFT_412776 [Sistotremastrum niveocremeum HHB9708]|uniref:Pyridoxal phosphate homeostasis protein n=2 Tax=Sistotremastraceae TaxID=3402574 RepID=A0A164TPA2_9AGAM|nr:hypothetical protein SISNIDRAFT_412776 [Sistotremastrum niveocremeum HHB9708]KZT42192.1 hypothetical protein SISSUDRAFT_980537 [Sistotremastrum suecicum HHB10207 ss-3]